uniref:Dual specificity tyrosine-phosphorylation-regulated kinase 4 n=1 Tax=Schistosoma haematobium TaxID=6185 RepID=A0A094ZXI6_SCHHA
MPQLKLTKGLRSQDNLSLNKYVLPTYRQENSFVKYITLENHSNSNSNSTNSLQQQHRHQTYQRNQKQSLLLQNSDLNTSKSQVLNTTTTTTNSTDSNHNPLLTRSIHYEIDQNDKSKSINITTTTTAGTSTTTTTSITTTNSSVDNLSDHLISSTKHLSKLVPPLVGLNEINVNDSQTLQHDLCISSSNNDNDNDDDHDDDDDDLSNPCHSQRDQSINNNNNDLLINNHHHNHWQDSIQSTCWLPKVAMNSNRTKCDEILSTNWNLLTMKNWKSDQELKRKMGLLNPHHHNKLGGGGFWFREKAFNHTKSFIPGSPSNHGYDDETGGYLKITHDHIAYRFQTLETLGKGSFGRVIRAIDHKSGFPVAIKIIRNKKRFHQQAQVEVDILENLKKADHKNIHNIIHIRDHFTFRNHLCIVFDLLGSNLYDLLRKNDFRGFTIHSLKKITIKLLNCLCLLRKQGIIHCDLKPENILIGLNNPSELKVIDFGSSCFVNQKTYTYIQSRFYRAPEIILGISYGPPIDMWSLGCILPELYTAYTYIQSRFYRAPEIILGISYGPPIDMWSLGCILPELYTGRPLFPGENENEQLACIMEVLGLPSELQLEKASRRRVFFGKTISLIFQCLQWDPDERITPNEALNHEWIIRETEQSKQNVTFQTLEQTNSENKQKDTIA